METLDQPRTDRLSARPESATDTPVVVGPVRIVLAALSAGAGAIHLAMVPSHAGEWMAEGVAFALAGWLQVVLAVVFLVQSSRLAVRVACVVNVVFVAAWIVTRTSGPPFGPETGVRHDASFVDAVCVAFEIGIVLVGLLALFRPDVGKRLTGSSLVFLSVIPVAVLALATAAIVSPSAVDHGHSDTVATGGHVHDDGTAAAASESASTEGGHDHGSSGGTTDPGDDKGLALLANGEMAHSYGADQPLDASTRALLVHQLALTRLIAERFPTLKDAKAAGSQSAGGFVPGLGIHMSTPAGIPEPPPFDPSVPSIPGVLSDAQIMHPANLLYDGTTDDARLAGFMYYSTGATEPEGFAGPNDHWHTHGSLCIKMAGKIEVLHPAEQTNQACAAVEGTWIERTNYMVHVWTVPGYESNRGVFSDINPALACPDGTYYQVPEQDAAKYKINKCRSTPE